MKKILKKGDVFTGWSIKLIGIQLNKQYGIDLNITGNNGNNYFKKRLEGEFNVYFMKHWSSFGEIYDAPNQQITNIVTDVNHEFIYEHWRGFSHPEVFDRYKTRGVKVAEYNHNFTTNDGLRLVFAREGLQSFVFWGIYQLDKIDVKSKTKVWKRIANDYEPVKTLKAIKTGTVNEAPKPVAKKPAAKKPVAKKPAAKKVAAKKPAKKVAKKPAKKAKAKK